MEEFSYQGKVVAFILRTITDGSKPVTSDHEPLQLVTLKHPAGTELKAHMHSPAERVTAKMQECLFLKKGKLKVDLYATDKTLFHSVEMVPGEALFLINCGIGIHMLEDSEAIEFKNGPFVEDKVLI